MSRQENSAGFTIIEVLVAMVIFSIGILAIAGLAASIQTAQRNNQYLNSASTAAKNIIENARVSQTGSLQYDIPVTKTSADEPSLGLIPNGQAKLTARYVEGTYGIKNLEVVVNYTVGTDVRSVFLSGYGGAQGIVQ